MDKVNIRFGDFCFEINPSEIKVEYESAAQEQLYIGEGSALVKGGLRLKKVKGRGVFFGEKMGENYALLEKLFVQQKEEILILPDTKPFMAEFTFLRQYYPEGGEYIGYEFVFTQVQTESKELPQSIKAAKDDSLWDIAYKFGCDTDELLRLNLHIENINFIKENEVVYLC